MITFKYNMRALAGWSVLLLLFVGSSALAEKLYKWRDASGTIQYSHTKPAGVDYEEITPAPQREAPAGLTPAEQILQRAEERARQRATQAAAADVAGEEQLREQQCQKLKNQLQQWQTYGRIRVPNPDGTSSILTDEQRQAKIDAARQQLADKCN